MSDVVKITEKNHLVFELKLAFVLIPLVALLGGVGFGMALAIQAAIIPMPWLFVLLVIPALSFIYLMKHYFKKIDCAVKI